jgi:phospholipase/carboxylesterase
VLQFTRQKIGQLDCVQAAFPDLDDAADAVVILCHGYGAPGHDLVPLAPDVLGSSDQVRNVRFLFPAAPLEIDPYYDARAWWPIDIERIQQLMARGEFREMSNSVPERLSLCRGMIDQIIEFAKEEFGVPAAKLIVGGFSQGAMLMTDVALNYPELLGGLIVWSGSLINAEAWTLAAARHDKLKIVQSHGTVDPILPFIGALALREMFESTGHDVNFVQFKGQHGIPAEAVTAARELIVDVVARA